MVDVITGKKLFFPVIRETRFFYAYRPNDLVVETVNATDFHVTLAYAQEGALRKTAKQIGVPLVGKMHEFIGYFFDEGYHNISSIQDG